MIYYSIIEGRCLSAIYRLFFTSSEEIYLRVNLDNPASLHVMLHNGGRVVGQDESHYYVRIANPGKNDTAAHD